MVPARVFGVPVVLGGSLVSSHRPSRGTSQSWSASARVCRCMAFDERGGCVEHEFHQEGVLGFGVFSHEWWFNLATKLVFSFWPLSGPIISSFKHSEQITN
mgnify:CR=1 FL=1